MQRQKDFGGLRAKACRNRLLMPRASVHRMPLTRRRRYVTLSFPSQFGFCVVPFTVASIAFSFPMHTAPSYKTCIPATNLFQRAASIL